MQTTIPPWMIPKGNLPLIPQWKGRRISNRTVRPKKPPPLEPKMSICDRFMRLFHTPRPHPPITVIIPLDKSRNLKEYEKVVQQIRHGEMLGLDAARTRTSKPHPLPWIPPSTRFLAPTLAAHGITPDKSPTKRRLQWKAFPTRYSRYQHTVAKRGVGTSIYSRNQQESAVVPSSAATPQ
jgi:hypothetical protein